MVPAGATVITLPLVIFTVPAVISSLTVNVPVFVIVTSPVPTFITFVVKLTVLFKVKSLLVIAALTTPIALAPSSDIAPPAFALSCAAVIKPA